MDSEWEGKNRGLGLSVPLWWVGATQPCGSWLPDSGSMAYLLPGGGAGRGLWHLWWEGGEKGEGEEGQSLSLNPRRSGLRMQAYGECQAVWTSSVSGSRKDSGRA